MTRPKLLQIPATSDVRTLQERCDRAIADGFEGVELHAHGVDSSTLADFSNTAVKAIAIAGTTTNVEEAVAETVRCLNEANRRGATCLNLSIPAIKRSTNDPGFESYQDAVNFAVGLLRAIRYEAERTGVCLALEAATGGMFLSPVELRELIDDAHCWAIGACVDLDRIAQIGSPEDWINTLTRRVTAVRMGIGSAEESNGLILRKLDAIQFDGPIVCCEM